MHKIRTEKGEGEGESETCYKSLEFVRFLRYIGGGGQKFRKVAYTYCVHAP